MSPLILFVATTLLVVAGAIMLFFERMLKAGVAILGIALVLAVLHYELVSFELTPWLNVFYLLSRNFWLEGLTLFFVALAAIAWLLRLCDVIAVQYGLDDEDNKPRLQQFRIPIGLIALLFISLELANLLIRIL